MLFRILWRANQRKHFRMTKIDIVPKNVDVNQFPNILLPLICRQRRVAPVIGEFISRRSKLLADVCQFSINSTSLFFLLLSVWVNGKGTVEEGCNNEEHARTIATGKDPAQRCCTTMVKILRLQNSNNCPIVAKSHHDWSLVFPT